MPELGDLLWLTFFTFVMGPAFHGMNPSGPVRAGCARGWINVRVARDTTEADASATQREQAGPKAKNAGFGTNAWPKLRDGDKPVKVGRFDRNNRFSC